MVNPGPTVPINFAGAEDAVAAASKPMLAAASSVQMSFMGGTTALRAKRFSLADDEAALHRGEVRVADVLVRPLDELDDHGLLADEADGGDLLVHAAGAAQVEVVDGRLVGD